MLPRHLYIGAPRDPPSVNVSLKGEASFSFYASDINVYACPGLELHWEILRADGETELYSVVNETYHYGRDEEYPESGLEIDGFCHFIFLCRVRARISPTDMRYDGAQLTAILNLPGCFNTSNSSDTMTLNIQGQFFTLQE